MRNENPLVSGPLRMCARFQWMPGMRSTDGCLVLAVEGCDVVAYLTRSGHVSLKNLSLPKEQEERTERIRDEWCRREPDLNDHATLGALLGLVQREWDDPHASVFYASIGSYVFTSGGKGTTGHATYADALIDALWSAP